MALERQQGYEADSSTGSDEPRTLRGGSRPEPRVGDGKLNRLVEIVRRQPASPDSASAESDKTSEGAAVEAPLAGMMRKELRENVLRMMRYAIAEAMIGVDSDFVGKIAPILSKGEQALADEDEKALWLAYQVLSKAIMPATDESLKLKEFIDREDWNHASGHEKQVSGLVRAYRDSYRTFKFLLWGIGLIFLVLQGYALFLMNILDGVEKQRADLAQINAQIASVRQASPSLEENKPPLDGLIYKRNWARSRMAADFNALRRISFPWGVLYRFDPSGITLSEGQAMLPIQLDSTLHAFHDGAKSVLNILNYLVLPTILGFLGSLAYVIRGILDSFSRSSITLGSRRSWETRVSLGGLLGLITGAVFAPSFEQFDEMRFSPMVWAFLMGYSVEFAFTVFDTAIERGRETLARTKGQAMLDVPGAGLRNKPASTGKAGPNA